jgi:hypothetical protein
LMTLAESQSTCTRLQEGMESCAVTDAMSEINCVIVANISMVQQLDIRLVRVKSCAC